MMKIIACLTFCFAISTVAAQKQQQALSGVIDLTHADFFGDEFYSLDGEWHFYWNEFVDPIKKTNAIPIVQKVRGHWRGAKHPQGVLPAQGFGTYRLLVKLPPNTVKLALKVPNVGTAYTLFANGQKIAVSGIASENETVARAKAMPQAVDLVAANDAGEIELIVHVSNYDDRHGGLWQTWRIGRAEAIRSDLRDSYALGAFLFGAIFIIGLHHLLLFWRRSSEKANLAFGLLCLLFAIRPLVESSRYLLVIFPEFPWLINSRLAYLTFYGSLPLSSWFLRRIFPEQFHRLVHRLILIVMIPAICAILFLPPRIYTETLSAIQIFSLLLIVYSLVSIARAISAGVRGAKTLGIGVLFLFITAAVDILTVANILNFPETASFGLVAFILSQSILISLRDEDAHHQLEKLAHENRDLITSMEQKIIDRTATIAELSAEGDAVLNALSEGVFLVNREKKIGNKFSARISEILEIEPKSIAGQSFSGLILQLTGEQMSVDAERFLKIIFNPMIDDGSIRDLNPLQKFSITGPKSRKEKVVTFDFARQWHQGEIMATFVSCRDITESETARLEIEKREAQANRQLEIVRTLFSVNPQALQAFYGSVENELEEIYHELSSEGAPEIRRRVENIYRAAHTIKGNAQLFNVTFLAGEVHAFEEAVQALLKREKLENLDMLQVHSAYTELEKSLNEFEAVILKIMRFQREASGMHMSTIDMLRDSLPKMVAEICEKTEKKAQITFRNFDAETVPRAYGATMRDAVVQCVRNALAHSIEMPAIRVSQGKEPTASITVSAGESDNALEISVRDDGKSFDLAAIRDTAVRRKILSAEAAPNISDDGLIALIYKSGFSTAEPGGQFAGRGAGMDIVAQKIKNLGGKIRIAWSAGKFTEFTFVLPKK